MKDSPLPRRDPIPAATVIIFRRCSDGGPPQLLMVQRAKEMRFAGGAAVFPGGRIDPADRTLAARLAPDADPELSAARVAAIRETLEETGLAIALRQPVSSAEAAAARVMLIAEVALEPVLDHFAWTLDLDALVPFARWCPLIRQSYDTHFFLTDLGTGSVDITVDATENMRLFWIGAQEALRLAQEGEIKVIFPTRRNLERLALFGSFEEARAQANAIPIRTIVPCEEERDGKAVLTIPDDLGYPITVECLVSAMRS